MNTPDPLEATDPRQISEHAHLEALLRCWLVETNTQVTPGRLELPLTAIGARLRAEVRYCSPTGWHRFGSVSLVSPDDREFPLEATSAVVLIATEAAVRGGARAGGVPTGEISDLAARTADSVHRVAGFVAARRAEPNPPPGTDNFLDAEQALLLGHLCHPAPKSRDGISDADAAAWAPEARASFALHWFAADPELVRHDAVAGAPSLRGMNTAELLAELAGPVDAPAGKVVVPSHPWQAADLLKRPAVEELVRTGRLRPLGPHGPSWWPTSSWRTVYRPDAPVMLKLSVGLRITNSRREATLTELRRGPEVNRLLDAGYAAATEASYPEFRIVRDPAWLAVHTEAGELTGLDVAVREVPPGIGELRCLVGLIAPRPGLGPSTLATLPAVSKDPAGWVAAYAARVLVPMLHLYAATGIGLEGHQQNTLVRLAPDGGVLGGAFRDNQGYYLATSHLPHALAALGRCDTEQSMLAVVDDATVDERLSYYLLRNQALAVVGALGVAGLADERLLLAAMVGALRDALPALADAGPGGDRLARRWLTAPTLPCKANLLTRLHGIDEVIAPLDAQSVYLDAPNPLLAR